MGPRHDCRTLLSVTPSAFSHTLRLTCCHVPFSLTSDAVSAAGCGSRAGWSSQYTTYAVPAMASSSSSRSGGALATLNKTELIQRCKDPVFSYTLRLPCCHTLFSVTPCAFHAVTPCFQSPCASMHAVSGAFGREPDYGHRYGARCDRGKRSAW